MSPKVSVITPVYNCKQYLRESVDSIKNQIFGDFEFIILDDGSTDGTYGVIRDETDARIIKMHYGKNKKIPIRRNEAISICHGEYIAIHDGDDISEADRLSLQVDFLDKNPDIFCVGGHATKIDKNGDEIGLMDYPPETHQEIVKMLRDKFYLNPIIDPTTMFRRDIFHKLGGYNIDEEIYTAPDYDLWLRAISAGYRFANIQKPIIKYRENSSGMTGQKKQEMIRAHMIIWRRFSPDCFRQIL